MENTAGTRRAFRIARHSWQEAVTRYVAEIMPHAVKASTATRYLSSFRTVDPILAGLHLDQIDRRAIGRIGGRKGPTNATRRRDLTAISQVLRAAVGWEWIDRNVTLEFDRSVIRERRDRAQDERRRVVLRRSGVICGR